jgi:multidrug resistance protein MdtO
VRTLVAALATMFVTQALHAPHGYWAVFTVFIISQPDAGTSISKAVQRIVGTLAGGVLAILTIVAFVDQPWFLVPTIFLVAAGGLYLSAIATASYAPLLGAMTFLMFVPEGGGLTPTLDAPLWRMAMIALGAAIGSAAQLVLWPDDPADLLRQDTAKRLRSAAAALTRSREAAATATAPALLEASGLARELQLLESAELLHPALVHRHAEQARLIGGVERALVAALAIERMPAPPAGDALRTRIDALGDACSELAKALEAAAVPATPTALAAPLAEAHGVLAAVVDQFARALDAVRQTIPAVLPLRTAERESTARTRLAAWLPLSVAAPDSQTSRFAARGGIATTLAYLVLHGLAWPGISTALLTPVICAQGSFGAGRQKATLRIAGALIGALLGIFTTVVLVPMVTTIAGYLLILAPSLAIAAWVTMGSPRIAYAGIQIALAFAMYGAPLGPSTELIEGRDRVVGIALGIALMTFLEQVLWPRYAGDSFGTRIATVLRTQSRLARAAGRPLDPTLIDTPERWNTLAAYRSLTATLGAIEESRFEPGGRADDSTRAAALALTARAQEVLLQLVTLVRARPEFSAAPAAPGADPFEGLADAQADVLAALADRLEGARDAAPSLAHLEQTLATLGAREPEHRLALHRSLCNAIRELAQSPELEQVAAHPLPSAAPA